MKKKLAFIIALFLLLNSLYVAFDLFVPVGEEEVREIEVEIPRGASFRQATDILAQNGLIRDKNVFLALGRLTGADRKIRAGYYSFWSSMRPFDIFGIIRKGRIIEYEIRILEGDSLLEIAAAFAKTGIIGEDDFLRLAKDKDFLAAQEISATSVEGYLFPDTYIVPKGTEAEDALELMVSRMQEKFTPDLRDRAAKIGMTEHEVLTLASIIEKEAVVDSERSVISAVYHNRLKKKMPLQADPTSIYGIKSSKERITKTDLVRKTPYNTYVIKGLPPGPIASPGMKSIRAALYPADVPYLYFVSNNDGTHQFSSTLGEHEEAVRSYRLKKQQMKQEQGKGQEKSTTDEPS